MDVLEKDTRDSSKMTLLQHFSIWGLGTTINWAMFFMSDTSFLSAVLMNKFGKHYNNRDTWGRKTKCPVDGTYPPTVQQWFFHFFTGRIQNMDEAAIMCTNVSKTPICLPRMTSFVTVHIFCLLFFYFFYDSSCPWILCIVEISVQDMNYSWIDSMINDRQCQT